MSTIIKKISLTVILSILFIGISELKAQKNEYKLRCVAFYNIENLFDTINNENVADEEFTPGGTKAWTYEKYQKKLNNMANVISQIGNEKMKGGPHVIGLVELENKGVLEDLINMPQLKKSKYDIVHYDSPDRRGVDVALLYRKDVFKVTNSVPYKFTLSDELNPFNDEFKSRDHLLVSGKMDGEEMHFIVNHWPSRRGGEKQSSPLRCAAADLTRSIVDSLLKINPDAKIVVMGDLNDDPINESVANHLRAQHEIEKMQTGDMYNPFYEKYKKGIGTTAYQDAWSLFDQLIISEGLAKGNKDSYKFLNAFVFNKKLVITKTGKYKGYPFRTFDFDNFQNGYSDHFPVYMFLVKEKK